MNQPETTTETGSSVPLEGPSASRPREASSLAAPLLMGVKLPIRILLGRTELSLREITQLGNGAVVELNCSPNDPVQIMVNDRLIAHGEIVVVGGNYGIRVTKIANKDEAAEPSASDNPLLNLSEKLR